MLPVKAEDGSAQARSSATQPHTHNTLESDFLEISMLREIVSDR